MKRKPPGRSRVSDTGRKEPKHARNSYTKSEKLEIVEFFANNNVNVTMDKYFPKLAGHAREPKRKLMHQWRKEHEHLELQCADPPLSKSQGETLPPCCHALTPGRKCSPKAKFASELAKFGVAAKADGVQRLASDLSAARAALQLEDVSAPSVFQSPDDIPSYTQKLAAYLALVKGFTESRQSDADVALQASVSVTDATVGDALRQPLVEGRAETSGAVGAAHGAEGASASARDCSGCLNFCRWQDALTGQTVYATSARQEYAHVLLAAGILMMTDAREKVDAILSERLSELDEKQLKLAYHLLLHAAGVLDACLESMDVAPRAIGAEFTDLGAKAETKTNTQGSADDVGLVPDDDVMAKWREEQRQAQQVTLQKAAPDSAAAMKGDSAKSPASGAAEDLAMLKRVPDLADGRFPQLLAWIALVEAQELVVLRGVTREVVDFTLMAKLSMDISARYKECQIIASRLLPYSTSTTAERIRLYCAYKEPYYQAISTYFQGAACMLNDDARNSAQAVANFKKAAALFEGVVPLEKSYESKMAADKDEKQRVALLAAVFLRSEQIISRDLDIVSYMNYEPIPAPEIACNALSLVKPTTFPTLRTSNSNRKTAALVKDAVRIA
ncbi:uncharacterized protein IUM83_05945 [Phytophthora cinnamomi]|uniref:uncharacterized protein n=1 Tax=Phytophthora cinnamomi TaxID=4785 RepID=UPI00355A1A8E|nr:hypothetical protein IUM83_05945 [Phytophthora cinnamomi]